MPGRSREAEKAGRGSRKLARSSLGRPQVLAGEAASSSVAVPNSPPTAGAGEVDAAKPRPRGNNHGAPVGRTHPHLLTTLHLPTALFPTATLPLPVHLRILPPAHSRRGGRGRSRRAPTAGALPLGRLPCAVSPAHPILPLQLLCFDGGPRQARIR